MNAQEVLQFSLGTESDAAECTSFKNYRFVNESCQKRTMTIRKQLIVSSPSWILSLCSFAKKCVNMEKRSGKIFAFSTEVSRND